MQIWLATNISYPHTSTTSPPTPAIPILHRIGENRMDTATTTTKKTPMNLVVVAVNVCKRQTLPHLLVANETKSLGRLTHKIHQYIGRQKTQHRYIHTSESSNNVLRAERRQQAPSNNNNNKMNTFKILMLCQFIFKLRFISDMDKLAKIM